jgi:hypothetical protein
MKLFEKEAAIASDMNFVLRLSMILFFIFNSIAFGQTNEAQTTTIRLGRLWLGMPANGSGMNFNPASATFFPNDYGIMADRAQYGQAFTGAGITLACASWPNPNRYDPVSNSDTVESPAVYGFTNTYLKNGKVIVPITNYLRYNFPSEIINSSPTNAPTFGTYNPAYAGFQNTTADEIAEVVDSTVFGVTVDRKVLAWSQSFNDDYVIADLIFTNVTSDTLDSLYINLQESGANTYFSYGNHPAPQANEAYDPTMCWQHYYGARPGDSLRVFYEYSADDPTRAGDNMGAPVTFGSGNLLAPNLTYYAILHASAPFDSTNPARDIDDPSQPRITYAGVATQIPYNSSDDQYGNKNFYAIRGAFSRTYSMPGATDSTHGMNTDEIGSPSYLAYVASQNEGVSYRTSSFGPYMFYPGQKIHIVIASGFSGIGYQKGQEVGEQWLNGTLQNPPNLPDTTTGWFPSNFQFPSGATEMDKRKDRWISTGIDSVRLSAWRAKWNYDHGYMIPQAPPPPQTVNISYTSHAVQINWTDPQAESSPNFAGYRIMRRVSSSDSILYEPVYDSDSTDVGATHSFVDSTVMYLSQTYYYIQSKARIGYNDLTADPTTRGRIMYSGRALYPNIYFLNRPGPAQDNLSKIRIAPNPYNIKDPMLVVEGWTDQRGIAFFNLPSVCTIKIFTENGDLVQTIVHNQAATQSGSEVWNMLTSSQQVIYSGVYIAVFQKPDGESSFQKFIVVR